jgi:ribosomal protein L34E
VFPAGFWLFPKLEEVKSSVKKIMAGILVQDFKNCSEQWPKCLECSKELKIIG